MANQEKDIVAQMKLMHKEMQSFSTEVAKLRNNYKNNNKLLGSLSKKIPLSLEKINKRLDGFEFYKKIELKIEGDSQENEMPDFYNKGKRRNLIH